MKKNRRLVDTRATEKFHFRYLGMWVLITVSLIAVLNITLYLLVMAHWGEAARMAAVLGERSANMPIPLVTGVVVEVGVFAAALLYLARLTSHRIAGPYIRLRAAFEKIRDGERTYRLQFREYDQLADLAATFNQMMDALCGPPDAPAE
jgi:methyl-accepting chemotaxis protein